MAPESDLPPKLGREEYTVAWVCILYSELMAARAMLDQEHQSLPCPNDQNSYVLGRMGKHNIVIVQTLSQGKASTAHVTANLVRSFPKVRFALIVGIGGGATTAPNPFGGVDNIRLGDVVVSQPSGSHGGILQYDFGKQYEGGFRMGSHLNKPAHVLISATGRLRSNHGMRQGSIRTFIDEGISKLDDVHFTFPGYENDRLFRPDYAHPEGIANCDGCDPNQIVTRNQSKAPSVHYGLIASADTVMKSATVRDRMREEHNVICFEMEAAGLMNNFPCIAIRGISDYGDSHKNNRWQPYAAITAAAYAKDLLAVIQPEEVDGTELAATIVTAIRKEIEPLKEASYAVRRNDILDWISPLNFRDEQRILFQNCVPAGKWLLDSDEFKFWVDGAPWRLDYCGATGTGKTNICAIIVNHLQQQYPRRPVIHIYLDENKQAEQSPQNLLGSLLRQLIEFDPSSEIPRSVQQHYDHYGRRASPDTEVICRAFEAMLESYERTYLVVDRVGKNANIASDVDQDYPLQLMKRSRKLSYLTTSLGYTENAQMVKCDICGSEDVLMYFTCQCNDDKYDICWKCRQAGETCPQNHEGAMKHYTVEVEVRAPQEELEEYCRHRVELVIAKARKKQEQRDERLNPAGNTRYMIERLEKLSIYRIIAEHAQGNFLVAKCSMDDILAKDIALATDQDLFDSTQVIPYDSLAKYVTRKLKSIEYQPMGQERRLAWDTLCFVYSAQVMPTLKMLKHALALGGNTGLIDLSKVDDKESVLEACKGLVVIHSVDDDEFSVSFFHACVKEVLTRLDQEEEPKTMLNKAHANMASICLRYLKHSDVLDHSKMVTEYPFLSYALEYWGDHVREACLESGESDQQDAFQFLQNTAKMKALAQAVELADLRDLVSWIHEGAHRLHICAWFGLSRFINRFVRDGNDDSNINRRDRRYDRTPLRYACFRGQVDSVRLLLELNADIEDSTLVDAILGFPDVNALALENEKNNRREIVRLLLQSQSININARVGGCGKTALMLAAKRLDIQLVKTLMEDDSIDLDCRDNNGLTVMLHGVQSLAQNMADPDLQDSCLELVSLFLQHGANPNIVDNAGQSALSVAVATGQTKTVEALLRCNQIKMAFPNRLVHFASANAHPTVISVLHANFSRNPGYSINALDEAGRTPLHHACQSSNCRGRNTIHALLERGADPNIADKNSHTASMLLHASQRSDVVADLATRYPHLNGLSSSSTEVGLPIQHRDLPALVLANQRRWDLIEDVIASASERADLKDHDVVGHTILHHAVMHDQQDLVNTILSARVVNPNCADRYGQSPLHLSESVHTAKTLVGYGCDIHTVDFSGDTALAAALRRENRCVVDYLLEAGASVTNNREEIVQHLLVAATRTGSAKAVEALVNHDPRSATTVLDWQAVCGSFRGWVHITYSPFKHVPLHLILFIFAGVCLVEVVFAV